jgi:hypothetical protein
MQKIGPIERDPLSDQPVADELGRGGDCGQDHDIGGKELRDRIGLFLDLFPLLFGP